MIVVRCLPFRRDYKNSHESDAAETGRPFRLPTPIVRAAAFAVASLASLSARMCQFHVVSSPIGPKGKLKICFSMSNMSFTRSCRRPKKLEIPKLNFFADRRQMILDV